MRANDIVGVLREWGEVKALDYRAVAYALDLTLGFSTRVCISFLEYTKGNNVVLLLLHESDYVTVLKSAPSSPVCSNMYSLLLFQLLQ